MTTIPESRKKLPEPAAVYPNHTRAFWNQIDKILPDYQERKEWLRVNRAGMDL